VIPGYHRGNRTINQCQHEKVTGCTFPGDSVLTRSYGFARSYCPTVNAIPTVRNYDQPPAVDWNGAIIGLANSVNYLVSSRSQLLVSFWEARKTWRMVRNPFGLMRGDWRARCEKRTISQLAKRGANLWLEYQYGWKSLLYDLSNFCVAAARFSVDVQRYHTHQQLRRYCQNVTVVPTPKSPSTSDAVWNANTQQVYTDSFSDWWSTEPIRIKYDAEKYQYRVGATGVDNSNKAMNQFRHYLSYFGLDPTQWLATIWEIIPYSFVVDWFVNTKSIMNTIQVGLAKQSLLKSVLVSSLCYSIKDTQLYHYEILPVRFGALDSYAGSITTVGAKPYKSSQGTLTLYHRYAGLPSGSASLLLNQGLSLTQWISGLSLFAQRVLS